MPVSTKQLTICDFSSDFEKFFNQNQTNLLTLLDKEIVSSGLNYLSLELESKELFRKSKILFKLDL